MMIGRATPFSTAEGYADVMLFRSDFDPAATSERLLVAYNSVRAMSERTEDNATVVVGAFDGPPA